MKQLLTESQVAEILQVGVSWLQKGRVYGYGPAFIKLKNPKGGIRYRPEDIEKFLEQSRLPVEHAL